jgi:hypothetical protein
MNIDTLLYIGALICFLLDAFRVSAAVNWTPLAFALLVATLLV